MPSFLVGKMDTRLTQLEKIGQTTGGRNPGEESEYQNLRSSQPQQPSQSNSGYPNSNPLDIAKQALQFQQQANAPVVQQLQGQVDPLKQRYTDLLASIKGQQQTAEGYTTRATTTELGRRGLLPQSEEGQRTLGEALQPITAQYQNISAQTGVQQQQDLLGIAREIANLQAGQAPQALQTGLGISNLNLQGQQLAQQSQQAQQDQDYRSKVLKLQQDQANIPNTQMIEVGGRKQLINTVTGEVIKDLGSSSSTSYSDEQSILSKIFGGNQPSSPFGPTLNDKPRQTEQSLQAYGPAYDQFGNYLGK